jgi:hypothetical protein
MTSNTVDSRRAHFFHSTPAPTYTIVAPRCCLLGKRDMFHNRVFVHPRLPRLKQRFQESFR